MVSRYHLADSYEVFELFVIAIDEVPWCTGGAFGDENRGDYTTHQDTRIKLICGFYCHCQPLSAVVYHKNMFRNP